MPPVPQPRPDFAQVITTVNAQLRDAYFDYDRSDAGPDAIAALRYDAELLRPFLPEFPALRLIVEGHCDERGSAEYNMGLGARRSARVAEILQEFGVPAARQQTTSFGKEMPQCTEETESCWSRNRRAHLAVR
jgi:peptidoglycan-associated lipoprotein